MRTFFHRSRRTLGAPEPSAVETSVELETDEQPHPFEHHPQAGNWRETYLEQQLNELRGQLSAQKRYIRDLEQRLEYATKAAAALPPPPAFYTRPADELAAVRADRDRLEHVNDGLRTRLEVKRVQLDDVREQLRLLRRGPVGDSDIPGRRADTGHVTAP